MRDRRSRSPQPRMEHIDTLHDATNAFASTTCEAYAETIHSHAAARDLSDCHHTITIHTHHTS